MSYYVTLALVAIILVQAVCAYIMSREIRQLKRQTDRYRGRIATLLTCGDKNEEFIQTLVKTNQEQAAKIRQLKNRISF